MICTHLLRASGEDLVGSVRFSCRVFPLSSFSLDLQLRMVGSHRYGISKMLVTKVVKMQTKRGMDGLRPKGHAGTADQPPGRCPSQNILEVNNSGR